MHNNLAKLFRTNAAIERSTTAIPASKLAVHFPDTNIQALKNINVALRPGTAVIDSSIGKSGGCLYAKGASGNVAAEKVIEMLNRLDIAHGINLEELTKVRQFICEKLSL